MKGGIADVCIQDSMMEAPVVIEDHPDQVTGKIYHTIFYAGVSMPKYTQSENTLSPSVDWAIIEKKQLTLEDLKNICVGKKSPYKENKNQDEICLPLLNFSFHLANALHIPNHRLIDLLELVLCFYYNRTSKKWNDQLLPSDKVNLQAYYQYLGNPESYRYIFASSIRNL